MSYINTGPGVFVPSNPIDPMPYISNTQPVKQPPMHSFMGGFLTGAAIAEDVKEGLTHSTFQLSRMILLT